MELGNSIRYCGNPKSSCRGETRRGRKSSAKRRAYCRIEDTRSTRVQSKSNSTTATIRAPCQNRTSPGTLCVRASCLCGPKAGTGRARGRSALGRLFDGGKGLGQHIFSVAYPLGQLCLAPALQRGRELFHIPYFRHARAGPAGLQAVGPAHIRACVGTYHELKAPAALGLRDHDGRRPRALAGPILAEEVIADLATAAALPLAADVLGAPLPHAREIGNEVIDGLRGRLDRNTGFPMHAVYGHEHSPQ